MLTFIYTLIPILALITLGFFLKRSQFIPEDTWAGIEKLTYFIFFPALLINTLSQQSIDGLPWVSMLIVISATLLFSTIVLILLRPKIAKNGAAFTSVFQGGIRFNTYITFAIAYSLYGITGLEMSSVAAGFMIVLINLLCVLIFIIWGSPSTTTTGFIPFIKSIIFNPLIVGCTIGWLLSLSDFNIPNVVSNVLEILGRAALPLGLLAVGAALRPRSIHGHTKVIVFSSLMQFAVKPLFAFTLIHYLNLQGIAGAVLLIAFMTPTAPSSYILARQLGGDVDSMASIITMQTLLAFIFMPILAMLLL